MKKSQWVAEGAAVFFLALLIGFFFLRGGGTGHNAPGADPARETPTAGADAGESVAGAPAEAPAGAEGAAPGEAPTVEVTEDMQRLLGVKTAEAVLAPLRKTIRLAGRIGYDEGNVATVNTRVEGWVEKLFVPFEGTWLNKGDPVAGIYSPELQAAQQELLSLLASKKTGGSSPLGAMVDADWERLREAARGRLRLWDISAAQIREIEKTGKPMRTLTIYSPVSGYAVRRYVTRGSRVMPGEPLLDLVNLSRVWVIADVSEPDAGVVRAGMPAKVTVAGLPGTVFDAKLDYVYPTMSADTRSLRVRATLPNRGGLLKPQMYATVEIGVDLGSRLLVPDDAVMDTGRRQVVYVDHGEGNFEPRTVTAGVRSDGMREIVSGLLPGERIASSALFLIDSEAQLKGVAPAPAQTPARPGAPAPPGAGQAPAAQGPPPAHAGHQH